MGRPRKQPRRIVTFNLNLPLAEAIDDLPVKNRSEWMNKNLPALLEDKDEREERILDKMKDRELFMEAEERGIIRTMSTERLERVLVIRNSLDLTLDNDADLRVYQQRYEALNNYALSLQRMFPKED